MPSLPQIIALKEKYGSKNNVALSQLRLLTKNFSFSTESIKKSFSYDGLDSQILNFFETQVSANLVMLFIDITSFSIRCKNYTNNQLALYLDAYYDIAVPIIYAHGGEVEKIMGDGIIVIFGQPFLNETKESLLAKADKCAKDLVMVFKNTDKEVKVALHDGNVMYYKNKTLNYPEYTVIGKPLTELYRLESVALNNSISYYHTNNYDAKDYTNGGTYCVSKYSEIICGSFSKSDLKSISLQGVDVSFIKHFTCTYRTS